MNVVVDLKWLANKPFDANTLEAKFHPLAVNIFRGYGFFKYSLHTKYMIQVYLQFLLLHKMGIFSQRNAEPLTVPLLVNDTIWVVKGIPDMTIYEIKGDQDTFTTKALGKCDVCIYNLLYCLNFTFLQIKKVTGETATSQTCVIGLISKS